MMHLPMDMPAEIHRWAEDGATGRSLRSEIVVAKGPLLIMAHGLMSIDPAARGHFWITSSIGDLTNEDVAEALREWSTAH